MQSSFARRCECYAREYSSTLCSLWRLLLQALLQFDLVCFTSHLLERLLSLSWPHFLSFFLSFSVSVFVCSVRASVFDLSVSSFDNDGDWCTQFGNSWWQHRGGGYCTLVQFSWRQKKKKKKKSLCQTEFCSALMRSYDKPLFANYLSQTKACLCIHRQYLSSASHPLTIFPSSS